MYTNAQSKAKLMLVIFLNFFELYREF